MFDEDPAGSVSRSEGVFAGFYSLTDAISDAGDATVVNSGDVTVEGDGAIGLLALTFGGGTAAVEMTGGTVVASAVDDPATTDIDERGIGVWASTGIGGMAEVAVKGGAQVRAPLAAGLEGGTTALTLDNGFLLGDVEFGDGDDTLTVSDFGYIAGDVSFGGGKDTLVFDVGPTRGVSGIAGSVTGLHMMTKSGTGSARVHDATFSGSALMVEDGGLIVRGHLDLGNTGSVTVHDAGRLTMEIGDIAADSEDHGRITAGVVVLEGGDPALFAALDSGLSDEQKDAAQQRLRTEGFTPLGEGTGLDTPHAEGAQLRTELETGEERTVGTVETSDDGTVAMLDESEDLGVAPETVTEPPAPPAPSAPSAPSRGGGSDGGKAIAIFGGSAFVFALFDLFDLFDVGPDDEEPMTGEFASVSSFAQRTGGAGAGTAYWVHALSGDAPVLPGAAGSLRGARMGFDTRLGNGFHIGMSGAPQLEAGATDNAFAGRRYALRGGWRSETFYANVGLSRGDYRARTAFANLDGLGDLSGTFGLSHERSSAAVGARSGIGRLRVDSSLSLFAGSVEQESWTAESAALRAQVPAVSQRYDGWKARLALSSGDWLKTGSVRWRPTLNLATARVSTDGPDSVWLRQSDKAGVLSFDAAASVDELPRTMHALGTGLSIARGEAWTLRGGYMAMLADGEPAHAAVARFRLRF